MFVNCKINLDKVFHGLFDNAISFNSLEFGVKIFGEYYSSFFWDFREKKILESGFFSINFR